MPKTATSKGSTVTVRVGANMKQTIQEYAKLREMTVGEFVRYAVFVYMDSTPADPRDDYLSTDEIAHKARVSGGKEIEITPGSVKRG